MKILINVFKGIFLLVAVAFATVYSLGSFVFKFFESGVGNPAAIMVCDSFFTRYKDRYFGD